MSSQDSPDSPSGSNSKNAMFEPKPKPKMIRVLTVLAYVLSVSMAAILLSIYYIFMWDGRPHVGARRSDVEMMEPHNYSEGRSIPMYSKYISHEDNLFNLSKLGLPTTGVRVDNETSGYYEEEINTTTNQHQDNTTDVRETQNEEKISVAWKLIAKAFSLLKQKMSYKSTNGIKLTKCDSQQWKTNSIHEASVKFAGEEAKDRLYEPKHKKKLVRVLTVVAYVFFVSLAAIMLSLYYVFLWNGDQKIAAKYVTSQPKQQRQYLSNKCNSILAELQQQITAIESEEMTVSSTIPTTSEEISVTWSDDYDEFEKPGIFFKKMTGRYDY